MSAGPAVWELEGTAARPERLLERRLLRRLWAYVRPQKLLIAESLALLLVTQLARLAQPTLIALAIDAHLVETAPSGNWGRVVAAWEPYVRNYAPTLGNDIGGRLMAAWLDR